jgi:hypothetical protein
MDVKLTGSVSFDQMVENNFHSVEKNHDKIQEAKIIFLGNTHYRQEHQWKISWLIQQMYQDGDIVLTETFYEHPIFCAESQFVAKQIHLKGWDSPAREREFDQKKCLIDVLLHIDHVRRNPVIYENWVKDVHQLVRMFPPPKHIHEEIICEEYPEEELAKCNSSEERLNCFNEIVCTLTTIWMEILEQQDRDTFEERNRCMVRTIDTHLYHTRAETLHLDHAKAPGIDDRKSVPIPNIDRLAIADPQELSRGSKFALEYNIPSSSRVFVIAGIAHLTLNKQYLFNDEDIEDIIESKRPGVELIHQYCSDKKYVVLYPNENNNDLQKIQEELRPPLGIIFRRFLREANYCTITKVILTTPFICLGAATIAAITLPLLVYKKVNRYCIENQYHNTLKNLNIYELLVLISHAADNPKSLPRQIGTSPLKEPDTDDKKE